MNRTVPKKKSYETPYTKKTQVELEESLCVTGSIDPTTKSPGMSTMSQDVNSGFNTDNDFTNDSWDQNTTPHKVIIDFSADYYLTHS